MSDLLRIPPESRSYDPSFFSRLFGIEDRHFWFRARNRVIATLVGQLMAGMKPGCRVLEVGCGTGNVLRILKEMSPSGMVVGMDLFSEGLRYARQRTPCPLVRGSMYAPPFAAQFEVIGVFDVLEHLDDDAQALRDLHALLAPQGALLLTVPAHSSLWSYFDEASKHRRRYELRELEDKLVSTGFTIEYMTQYMMSIYPLVWGQRKLATLLNHGRAGDKSRMCELASSELRIQPIVNELMVFLLAQEARFIKRRQLLPIGTSILALARRGPMRP